MLNHLLPILETAAGYGVCAVFISMLVVPIVGLFYLMVTEAR